MPLHRSPERRMVSGQHFVRPPGRAAQTASSVHIAPHEAAQHTTALERLERSLTVRLGSGRLRGPSHMFSLCLASGGEEIMHPVSVG